MVIKNKKGQLKIQQMAFMLLAVTLFFALAGMFILMIKMSELKETATLIEEKDTKLLVTKLANSPEFACGKSFNNINCIDADKIMVLKANIGKYANFWGDKDIEIRKIYPAGEEKICTIGNYPDCNVIRIYEKERKGKYDSNFVALCRKENSGEGIYDKCELANLLVSSNKK